MLLVLQRSAVPIFEDLAQTLVVLVLEAVKLDDGRRVALENADLVALGCSAPLCAADVAVVEGEGVAAARGLPTEAGLCESALATLLREVEVDVVKALADGSRG